MSFIEKIKRDLNLKMAISTFKTSKDGGSDIYSDGVDNKGRDVVPLWMKYLGCAPVAIPILGGVFTLVKLNSQHGYEHMTSVCAASVGLLIFGVTTRFVKRKN